MEVIDILPYPPQLQEEHKDPYVLDKDNNIIQGSVENKSCSKWQKIMLGTIQDVMVISPYPPQLQEEQKDPCVLDKDNNIIQESVENKSCTKWQKIMLGTISDVMVILNNSRKRGPYALSGVVEDRGGWPWNTGWVLTWFLSSSLSHPTIPVPYSVLYRSQKGTGTDPKLNFSKPLRAFIQ